MTTEIPSSSPALLFKFCPQRRKIYFFSSDLFTAFLCHLWWGSNVSFFLENSRFSLSFPHFSHILTAQTLSPIFFPFLLLQLSPFLHVFLCIWRKKINHKPQTSFLFAATFFRVKIMAISFFMNYRSSALCNTFVTYSNFLNRDIQQDCFFMVQSIILMKFLPRVRKKQKERGRIFCFPASSFIYFRINHSIQA